MMWMRLLCSLVRHIVLSASSAIELSGLSVFFFHKTDNRRKTTVSHRSCTPCTVWSSHHHCTSIFERRKRFLRGVTGRLS